ncbi:MAG TPA: cellulase family glycosylhydrolase [Pseudonocardia sp.]|nr:cellulase family glycosylhydrolase [Pseudonocardia sp.]
MIRPGRGALALALGLAMATALCAARPGRSDAGSGARAAPLELGVTVFSMWRDWDQHERWFQRAADSGVRWLRVDVGWCSLEEAGPGQVSPWYQGRLDVTADSAARLGLKLLVDVTCAPKWAGSTATGSYPADPAEFERVARYLADRYKGRVAAWEIWNEPNCIGGCGKGSPERFVAVLKAGYRGVKAGDPDAIVVSGGTSGNDVSWLRRMYAAGGAGAFDALAVHPYQDPPTAPPDAPSEGDTYRFSTLPQVHELMAANGDGTKPIWLTEFGWTTAGTGPRRGVDEATQARFLLEAVRRVQRDYPFVSHAFWFCLRDRDDWTPYENAFGLLGVDGTPKPGFAALRVAGSGLKESP